MNKVTLNSPFNIKQKGITFLEVLVALVIIVTGILGAVAMQATAKQASFDAMQRSLASSFAQDIIARIRANEPDNLALYAAPDYGGVLDRAIPAVRCSEPNSLCTSLQMVTNDIFEWESALMGKDVTNGTNNRGGLVDGKGCIIQNGNALTVVVSWQGRNEMSDNQEVEACGDAGDKRRQVVVQVFVI